MGIDPLFRKAVLAVSGSRLIRHFFEKRGMRLGFQRFVAGTTMPEALRQAKRLNDSGLLVTLDFLGEIVYDPLQVEEIRDTILRLLDDIHRMGLKSNVSVKLSQLGLMIDEDLCLEQMIPIVERARSYGNFIRIDMEDSSLTKPTLTVFKRLLYRFGTAHVGVVIQSYLYRSLADVDELTRLGANLRIVKGAYREPKEVAYPDKQAVDNNYERLVKMCLDRGQYVAIATHDLALIEELRRYIRERNVPAFCFEFQMLYGIAPELQLQLAAEGYRVRVYTPFGEYWYPYFSRRIAERPANLWFVIRGLLRK